MYNKHFGFREKPFDVTPNPRLFYTNPVYQEAYAALLYGIRERKGFVVLTGEVGTGKTTLLRRLMENLEATVRFVFVFNTSMTFDEILTYACDELGLTASGKRFMVPLAVACSILTIVGTFYSPPGGVLVAGIINRFLTLFAVWGVTILSLQKRLT